LIASTAINESPERNRTKPRCIGGAVSFATFDREESENAGVVKGIVSAIPSADAIAIETCFVKAMSSSIAPRADVRRVSQTNTKLRFRKFVEFGWHELAAPAISNANSVAGCFELASFGNGDH
jgi:hypothetical protein